MNKFRCVNEECIEINKDGWEDNKLILHIEEGQYTEYTVADDGSLEYHDSDGIGQEIYLRCPLCNEKYEFDYDYFEIHEKHVLPFSKRELEEDIEIIKTGRFA